MTQRLGQRVADPLRRIGLPPLEQATAAACGLRTLAGKDTMGT
jgi:hypothetical protein